MIKILVLKRHHKSEDFLLKLRNEPYVSENSLKSEKITLRQHHKWLLNIFGNPKNKIFLIKKNNMNIGYIREKKFTKTKYLSWALIKEQQGKGIMTNCLKKICFDKNFSYKAIIKNENFASINLAKKVGFKLIKKQKNQLLFLKV